MLYLFWNHELEFDTNVPYKSILKVKLANGKAAIKSESVECVTGLSGAPTNNNNIAA